MLSTRYRFQKIQIYYLRYFYSREKKGKVSKSHKAAQESQHYTGLFVDSKPIFFFL